MFLSSIQATYSGVVAKFKRFVGGSVDQRSDAAKISMKSRKLGGRPLRQCASKRSLQSP